MNRDNKKGFTLIELLVVISIIGLLSSIVLASLANAKQKGNDSKVQQELTQIRNAMELYRANSSTGIYPTDMIQLTGATPPYLPASAYSGYGIYILSATYGCGAAAPTVPYEFIIYKSYNQGLSGLNYLYNGANMITSPTKYACIASAR